MKQTPREALLARHAAAVPELNAIRLSSLPPSRLSLGDFLRELIVPASRSWAALALIWILILTLKFVFPQTQPEPAAGAEAAFAQYQNSIAQIDAFLR